jgi:hypothetical protein
MITRQAGKLWDETGLVDYVAYSLEAWFPVFVAVYDLSTNDNCLFSSIVLTQSTIPRGPV